MVEVTITKTQLATGYSYSYTQEFDNKTDAFVRLTAHLDLIYPGLSQKYIRAAKRVRKGTSQGIKLFYTLCPGVREYIWIKAREINDIII